MDIAATISDLRTTLNTARSAGKRVGFVPTMGALHAGHRSLVERARSECDIVVVSIFVNPLQFAVGEDLSRYPRPFQADVDLLRQLDVDVVFHPSVDEMYPGGPVLTSVHVANFADDFEGASRPGHFDGMATVVAKLFAIVGECRAYFGEKDWQQLAIVRRMVADLSLPIDVVGCVTVRDADGLALSSRNIYLDATHRQAATSLSKALNAAVDLFAQGETNAEALSDTMNAVLDTDVLVNRIYATVVNADFVVPVDAAADDRLIVAAQVGPARLIDNMGVKG
jgi:pantoate--beta-alanine ligase